MVKKRKGAIILHRVPEHLKKDWIQKRFSFHEKQKLETDNVCMQYLILGY